MKSNRRGSWIHFFQLFGLGFSVASGKALFAQQDRPARLPIVRDWSYRSLAYGAGSFRASTVSQLSRDPRLLAAWVQRGLINGAASAQTQSWRRSRTQRDWAVPLGATSTPREVFPAMWGKDFTTTSCDNDFVVFPINAAPSQNQANIIAFHQLYTNCLVQSPKTLWAYRIGDGPVGTSPVLSLDGSEVAFVENSSAGATFHVLKWVANQGSGPFAPATPCKSCLRSVTYASKAPSSRSSPFVDYGLNVAFVGADNGTLYAIGPVFGQPGTEPLAVRASVTITSGRKLTSPVAVPAGSNGATVLVSDGSSLYSYAFSCSGGSCSFVLQGQYTVATTEVEAIQDSALVDVDRRRVFWFARSISATLALLIESDYSCGNVLTARIGPGWTTAVIRSGTFDEEHFRTSGLGGHLYVCGTGSQGKPVLYRFQFVNGDWTRQAPVTNENVSSNPAECSPLTSFFDGRTDRLFLGVSGQNENQSEVQMWLLPVGPTNSDWPDARVTGYGGGASGIVVDNRSSDPQRNNIYFLTPLPTRACANQVCAVKLTQSGLQ